MIADRWQMAEDEDVEGGRTMDPGSQAVAGMTVFCLRLFGVRTSSVTFVTSTGLTDFRVHCTAFASVIPVAMQTGIHAI